MGHRQPRGMPGNRGQFAPSTSGKTAPMTRPSPQPAAKPNEQAGESISTMHAHYRAQQPDPGAPGSEPVTIAGTDGQTWQVTPGVLDDTARDVLLGGQCHALARAVSERTGWPMVAALDRECSYNSGISHVDFKVDGKEICTCQFNHVLVEGPDGRLLDAAGWHTTDELDEDLSFMPQTYLRGNEPVNTVVDRLVTRKEMREPATEVAATFVTPLLDRHATGPAR